MSCQNFDANTFGNHFISHGYDHVQGMMSEKYGLDLDAIKDMDAGQLAIMKDAADKSAWLVKNYKVIEDMIGDLIDGQVTWSQLDSKACRARGLHSRSTLTFATPGYDDCPPKMASRNHETRYSS